MGLMSVFSAKVREKSEQIDRERAEYNFRTIDSWIKPDSRVLDVGAWTCYLGRLLRDRRGCDVLSLDVVDANRTDMPFQKFDGRNLPVPSGSMDVVLLLYVLHHAREAATLFREARRVVRENGQVLVAEDCVDGLWNRMITFGFHIYLWAVTGMRFEGRFRTRPQWERFFRSSGFTIRKTTWLGHHLGHALWPNNMLFVLEPQPVQPELDQAEEASPRTLLMNDRNSTPVS